MGLTIERVKWIRCNDVHETIVLWKNSKSS